MFNFLRHHFLLVAISSSLIVVLASCNLTSSRWDIGSLHHTPNLGQYYIAQKNEFKIFEEEISGIKYFLFWDSYRSRESFIGVDEKLTLLNFDSPVKLVRREKNDENLVLNDEVTKLQSHNGKGTFSIIVQPKSSTKVLISQNMSGTGAVFRFIVDLATGRIETIADIVNTKGYDCQDIPFKEHYQALYIFTCNIDDETEALYTYNLVSEKAETIEVLSNRLSFHCSTQFGTEISYQFTETSEVVIDICNSSQQKVDQVFLELGG